MLAQYRSNVAEYLRAAADAALAGDGEAMAQSVEIALHFAWWPGSLGTQAGGLLLQATTDGVAKFRTQRDLEQRQQAWAVYKDQLDSGQPVQQEMVELLQDAGWTSPAWYGTEELLAAGVAFGLDEE